MKTLQTTILTFLVITSILVHGKRPIHDNNLGFYWDIYYNVLYKNDVNSKALVSNLLQRIKTETNTSTLTDVDIITWVSGNYNYKLTDISSSTKLSTLLNSNYTDCDGYAIICKSLLERAGYKADLVITNDGSHVILAVWLSDVQFYICDPQLGGERGISYKHHDEVAYLIEISENAIYPYREIRLELDYYYASQVYYTKSVQKTTPKRNPPKQQRKYPTKPIEPNYGGGEIINHLNTINHENITVNSFSNFFSTLLHSCPGSHCLTGRN